MSRYTPGPEQATASRNRGSATSSANCGCRLPLVGRGRGRQPVLRGSDGFRDRVPALPPVRGNGPAGRQRAAAAQPGLLAPAPAAGPAAAPLAAGRPRRTGPAGCPRRRRPAGAPAARPSPRESLRIERPGTAAASSRSPPAPDHRKPQFGRDEPAAAAQPQRLRLWQHLAQRSPARVRRRRSPTREPRPPAASRGRRTAAWARLARARIPSAAGRARPGSAARR